MRHYEDDIIRIAVDQGDAITTTQVRETGASDSTLRRLLRPGGLLVPTFQSVHRLAENSGERSLWWASTLAAGSPSALIRRTGARSWGLDGVDDPGEIDLWHPKDIRIKGIRGARSEVAGHLVRRGGLLVTDVPMTLANLGAVAPADVVECAFESALRLGLCTYEEVAAMLGVRGATGLGVLRAVLERRPPDLPTNDSWFETKTWQLLRDAGRLPSMPRRQYPIFDPLDGKLLFRMDLAFEDAPLYIESDGKAVHSSSAAYYRDRYRRNMITRLSGRAPIELTVKDVIRFPQQTVQAVVEAYHRTRLR